MARLIEEADSFKAAGNQIDRATLATPRNCAIFNRKYKTEECFLNPLNLRNRIDLTDDKVTSILGRHVKN